MAGHYGLKVFSDNPRILEPARSLIEEGIFHYLELTPVPNTYQAPFIDSSLPFVIHVTTERWGFNIADADRERSNRDILRVCISWADSLDADMLVLHPGYGDLSSALDFLSGESDPRIVIENMPFTGLMGEPMIGYSPSQIHELMGTRFGHCLDLNHAIKAAISLQRDYRTLIREFISLKPGILHIADGSLGIEKDEHLPIGAGEYDIAFLKRCIEECGDAPVTFETPRHSDSLMDDLQNLERYLAIGRI